METNLATNIANKKSNQIRLFSNPGTESWSLISGPCMSTVQPPARYYHSAVIYGNQMYIYGGMNNLYAKSDFWRWNLSEY